MIPFVTLASQVLDWFCRGTFRIVHARVEVSEFCHFKGLHVIWASFPGSKMSNTKADPDDPSQGRVGISVVWAAPHHRHPLTLVMDFKTASVGRGPKGGEVTCHVQRFTWCFLEPLDMGGCHAEKSSSVHRHALHTDPCDADLPQ